MGRYASQPLKSPPPLTDCLDSPQLPGLNYRVASFLEARKCLSNVSRQTVDQPELWANLLGAIANLSIAALPADIFIEVERRDAQRRKLHRRVREHLKEKLSAE